MADGNVIPSYVKKDQVFEFDIYNDPRIGEDVQGDYQKVLSKAPDVFWSPLNGGHWIVQRLDYLTQVAREYEYFSERAKNIPRVENEPFFIPLSLDPPESVPYRQVMMPPFSPKAVAEMEPTLRMWAKRLVDEVADNGKCDFIHDISSRYPVSIFMELMGMDLGRLREFRELADDFFNAHDAEALTSTSEKITTQLKDLIEFKKKNPGKDLTTYFINVDMEGRKLRDDEVLAMVFILFLGGMDTVTNVTGFSYRLLAQEPELQARLAADYSLIPKFVEEALRCFAVVNIPRLCVKTHERFGVEFHEGDMVLGMLPMGGRDDRVLTDPERFSIDRGQFPHITFSSGPHLCLGHLLARAEMRILTEEWLKRIPHFKVTPNRPHPYRTSMVCALVSLPLEWDAKKA